MADNVRNYTSADMTPEALLAAGPVLLDCWAAWCGPCRMVAPIVEQIANENAGKLTVAKLNIDEFGAEAVRLGVMSIPTLILFKDGQPVDKRIGYMPKNELEQMLKKAF